MQSSWVVWCTMVVAAGMSVACGASGGATGFGDSDAALSGGDGGTVPPRPIDPRPPEERACPTGATLTIELYRVYAMPLRPDQSSWDGVSSDTVRLICRASATAIREAVRTQLSQWAPGTGKAFNAFVGDTFAMAIASQCGLIGNWLQMRYEGPDMFVRGGSLSSTLRWTTPAEQDSWVAPRQGRAPWPQAVWHVPCRDTSTVMTYDVFDEDLAFDDEVETNVRFVAANVSPEAICGGWGWIPGRDGLLGSLFRLEAWGRRQSCEGIQAHSFQDFVIEGQPVGSEAPPSSTPPSPTPTGGEVP